ncbi:hypothetical protein HDU97_008163 [Phlyctochytrium planicorne]|nr:hypothetical protein HDU97_008163 [Phlyctochytrium planicorne]
MHLPSTSSSYKMRTTTTLIILALLTLQLSALFVSADSAEDSRITKKYGPSVLKNPWLTPSFRYATKFNAVQVWFEGRRTWCFKFGGDNNRVQTPLDDAATFVRTGNVLLPRYPNGKIAGDPIFDRLPSSSGYSDAWSAKVVTVPRYYKKDRIRNYDFMLSKGFKTQTVGVYNFPLITKGSKLLDWKNVQYKTRQRPGWYKGNRVRFYDFGAIQIDINSKIVPTGEIYSVINGTKVIGSPIVSSIPNTAGYTGFYSLKYINVDKTVAADSINSAPGTGNVPSSVYTSDPKVILPAVILNCPNVYAESNIYNPAVPALPPTTAYLPTPPTPPTKSNIYYNGPPRYITDVPAFYRGQPIFCFPFGTNSARALNDLSAVRVNTLLVPVYTTPNQDGTPRSAGRPVAQFIPGVTDYSDAVLKINVFVDDSVVANTYRTFSELNALPNKATVGIFNHPIVPRFSQIYPDNNYYSSSTKFPIPTLTEAWFNGRLINYFSAYEIKIKPGQSVVVAQNAVYNDFGQTIVSAIPADEKIFQYSGFYNVFVAKKGETSLSYTDYTTDGLTYNVGVFNCPTAALGAAAP